MSPTDLGRRELFAAGMLGLGLAVSAPAQACSLAPKPRAEPFSERRCRQELEELVAFLNRAHAMSMRDIALWVEPRGISIDADLAWFDDGGTSQDHQYKWFQQYRINGGKVDSRPVRILDMNLIRSLGRQTAYQFTLRSFAFHPEDIEGCNGLFGMHGEYVGNEDRAYIAAFYNNRLRRVRAFPEWFLERDA